MAITEHHNNVSSPSVTGLGEHKTTRRQNAHSVNILMYHSISEDKGPTAIPTDIFKMQMDEIEARGNKVIPLTDVLKWHRGELDLPSNSVAITFDDGFADFATNAFPELYHRKWPVTVFIPTQKIGACEDWDEKPSNRRLMDWKLIEELSKAGVEFGGHSANHVDLTKLSKADLVDEIYQSKEDIADHLNYEPTTFAQPFGHSNRRVRETISHHFDLSVGTNFAKAKRKSNPFELPRIEMHYFRDHTNWQTFLLGDGSYLKARQSLRGLRRLITWH